MLGLNAKQAEKILEADDRRHRMEFFNKERAKMMADLLSITTFYDILSVRAKREGLLGIEGWEEEKSRERDLVSRGVSYIVRNVKVPVVKEWRVIEGTRTKITIAVVPMIKTGAKTKDVHVAMLKAVPFKYRAVIKKSLGQAAR